MTFDKLSNDRPEASKMMVGKRKGPREKITESLARAQFAPLLRLWHPPRPRAMAGLED